MGFMQRDFDLRLVFLIVLVVVAIVFLTIFYQFSFQGLIEKHEALKENLNITQKNLTDTKAKLNLCQGMATNVTSALNETLTYQEKSREEYNKIYQQTETSLTKTKSELNSTKKTLEDTTEQLVSKTNQLSQKIGEVQDLNDEVSKLNKDVKRYKDDLDELENKIENCQSGGGLCSTVSW